MAVIPLPPGIRIKRIIWDVDQPAQINESRWTGDERVMAEPWFMRWSGQLELTPIIGEAASLAYQAFLLDLKGRVNTFRLPAVEGPQLDGNLSLFVLGGAPKGATSLQIYNLPFNTLVARRGMKLTINDQLLMLRNDLVSNGSGHATAQLGTYLRMAAPHSTPVELRDPTLLAALAQSNVGWEVEPGQIYGVRLAFRERFRRA
jgi:hypothetical protein